MGVMFSQHKNNVCGAYAIINTLSALDKQVDYDTVVKLSGTTKNGTSRRGIQRALKTLGCKYTPYFTRNTENASKWLSRNAPYNPIVLLVDDYEHYVVITGTMNGSMVLVDSSVSSGNEKNVHVISKQHVLDRWCHRGGYWAIKVTH